MTNSFGIESDEYENPLLIENSKFGVPPATLEKVISPSLDPLQLTPKPLKIFVEVTSAENVIESGSDRNTESVTEHPLASVAVITYH
jgi:hypothetical protein